VIDIYKLKRSVDHNNAEYKEISYVFSLVYCFLENIYFILWLYKLLLT